MAGWSDEGQGGGGSLDGVAYSAGQLTVGEGNTNPVTTDYDTDGTGQAEWEVDGRKFASWSDANGQLQLSAPTGQSCDLDLNGDDEGTVGRLKNAGATVLYMDTDGGTVQFGESGDPVDDLTRYHSTRGAENVLKGTFRTVAILKRTSTSPQTIPHNTSTALTWNVETYDDDAYVDLGTDATRVTVPAAGTYRVSLINAVISDASSAYAVDLRHFDDEDSQQEKTLGQNGSLAMREQTPFAIFEAVAGDYFVAYMYQGSGSDKGWPRTASAEPIPRLVVELLQE